MDEKLVPFDMALYQKEESRLRNYEGFKPKSARMLDESNIAVIWDTDPPKKNIYDLSMEAERNLLRLLSDEVELRTRVWVDTSGYYRLWCNFMEPPFTEAAQEASTFFSHWVPKSLVIVSTSGGKMGGPTSLVQKFEDQSALKKVPRTGPVANWKIVLEHDPGATVGVGNLTWFFGGTEHSINNRIQQGELPKPLKIPGYKKGAHRRWSLAEVAKYQHKFVGSAKTTIV